MGIKIKENDIIKDLAGQPYIIHGTDVDNSLSSTSENTLNERVIYNEISKIDTSVTLPDLSGKMPYSSKNAIENEGISLKEAADKVKADFKANVRDTSSFEPTSPLTAGTNIKIKDNIVTGSMSSQASCVGGTYFDNWGSTSNYEVAKYAFTTVNAESTSYANSVNTVYVNNDKLGTTFIKGLRLYLYFPNTLTTSYYVPIHLNINGKEKSVKTVGPTGIKDWKPSNIATYSSGTELSTRTNDPLGYDYYYDKNAFASPSVIASVFRSSGVQSRSIVFYGSWSDSSWETSILEQDITTSNNIIAQSGTFMELYYNGTDWLIKGNPMVASIPYYLYNIASSSGLRFRTDVGVPVTSQSFARFDYYANGYFELRGYMPILNNSTSSQDSGVNASQPWFMYLPIRGSYLNKEMTSVAMQDYGSTTSSYNNAYCFGTANTDVGSSTSVANATQNALHTYNYGGLNTTSLQERTRLRFFHDRYCMGRFFSIQGYLI